MERLLQIEQELAALPTRKDRERALQNLSKADHAALVARQRLRLAGRHEAEPVPGRESQEVTLKSVSHIAAIRIITRELHPELKPDSPAWNKQIQMVLKATRFQDGHLIAL